MDERKEDQERKAFVDDINYFLAKEQFNLFDFHERVLVSYLVAFIRIERPQTKIVDQTHDMGRRC